MPDTRSRRFDVLSMGRSCIDLYAHQTGVPITGVSSFDAYVGGCPTNVSVGARRLGLRVALLTAVGTDQVGDFVLDFLAREGVDASASPRFADRRTSAALVTIQPPDSFPLTFYRDNCADLALSIADVVGAPLQDSRLLFVTGTALAEDPSRTATLFAAERARRLDTMVVADIDYRTGHWPTFDAFGTNVRALLRHADIAIGTADEICAASGVDVPEDGMQVLLESVPAVILKKGADGAMVCRRGEAPVAVPPYRVEVVNVLGAGDAFASGVIYGVLEGWSLEQAAALGNATGAIVVTRHGCANFMPTLREVRDFLDAQGQPSDQLILET